jgi:hypothetical protein
MPNEFVARNGVIAQNNSTVSGSLTVTNGIVGSLTGTASYANNADTLDGLNSSVFASTASFQNYTSSANAGLTALNAQTASLLAYTASQNILNGKYATTGSNTFNGTQTITGSLNVSGNITTPGTITATTLVIQTITSSQNFVTGSTKFGILTSNTHQFTGSVSASGSLDINGTSNFQNNVNITSGNRLQWESGNVAILNSGNNLLLQTYDSSLNTKMFISASGNVGIGTTSPTSRLEIKAPNTGTTTNYASKNIIANSPLVGGYTGAPIVSMLAMYDGSIHGTDIGYLYDGTGYGLVFSVNNDTSGDPAEAMRINRSGNVGIGTTSPSRKLDVNGTSVFRDFTSVFAGSGNIVSNITWLSTDSGIMNIYTGGTATVQLNSSGASYFNGGNLGIGTTSPNHQLAVYNVSRDSTTALNAGNSNSIPAISIQSSTGSWASTGNGFAYYYNATNGNLDLYRKSNSTTENHVMTWTRGDGNVGIGTTSPATLLDIRLAATDNVTGSVSSSYAVATFVVSGSGGGQRGLQVGGPAGGITSPVFLKVFGTSNRFGILNQSNVENLTILEGGSVGIGTISPGYRLDVQGTGRFTGQLVLNASNNQVLSGNELRFYRVDNAIYTQLYDGGGSNGFVIDNRNGDGLNFQSSGTSQFRIASNGSVGIGTTSPSAKLDVAGSIYYSGIVTSGGLGSRLWIPGQAIGQTTYAGLYGMALTYLAKYESGWKSVGGGVASAITIDEGYFSFSNTQGVGSADSSLTWTTRLMIDTDGRVGIGTTSPAATLDVVGTGRFSSNLTMLSGTLRVSGSSSSRLVAESNYSGGNVGLSLFNTSGTEVIWLNAANGSINGTGPAYFGGSVGIGTTSPAAELQVGKSSDVTIALSNSTSVTSGNRGGIAWYNSSVSTVANIRAAAVTDNVGTELQFYIRPAAGNLTQAFTIASTRQSLFNTTTDTTTGGFGNTTVGIKQLSDGGAGGGLHIEQNSNTNVAFFGFTGTAFRIGTSYRSTGAYTPIEFTTNAATRLYIETNGNIGIGTTSPAEKFHLDAGSGMPIRLVSSGFSGIEYHNTNGTWKVYIGTETGGGGARYNSADSQHTFYNNSNAVVRINSSGNVGIGTTSPSSLLNVHGSAPYLVVNDTSANDFGMKIRYGGSETHGLHFLYNANSATASISNTYPATSGQQWGDIHFRQNSGDGTMVTRMMIKADGGGNVGIGTTSPGVKLDVAGSIRSSNVINWNGGVGALSWDTGLVTMETNTSTAIQLKTNGSARIHITAGGDVGIGTTSPGQKLHVAGFTRTHGLSLNDGTVAGFIGYEKSWLGSGSNDVAIASEGGNNIRFYTNGTTSVRMMITTGGNVGIGTTSPSHKLDVNGDITGRGAFNGYASSTHNLLIDWSSESQVTTLTATNLFFGTNAQRRMTILSGGFVGINTSSPGYIFHVKSNADGGGLALERSTGGASTIIRFKNENSVDRAKILFGGNVEELGFYPGDGNTEAMRITSGGNVGIGSTSPGFKLDVSGTAAVSGNMSIGTTYNGFPLNVNGTTYIIGGQLYLNVGYKVQNTSDNSSIQFSDDVLNIKGSVLPIVNGTQNLGSSSYRWATVFTSDLDMSNGIGDYTIVEGEEDLFLYNNKTNKVFKFVIQEVDPSEATPKMKR